MEAIAFLNHPVADSAHRFFESVANWVAAAPLPVLGAVVAVIAVAFAGNFVVKQLILRAVSKMLGLVWSEWKENTPLQKAIHRLANIVPAIIILVGSSLIPHIPDSLLAVIEKLCVVSMVLSLTLTLTHVLDALNLFYEKRAVRVTGKSIKGYLQITKILLYLFSVILTVSLLVNKSPLILLSGVGAITAILLLIFQDTLLSLVASVQISSGDLVRVGDWIEMPNLNADGNVIDIALHTVKVQNWDKTITTIPTRRLITDPFKNWRGMHESGGRRIKRAIYLDQSSIRFLNPDEVARLKKFALLKEYMETKEREIAEWNARLGEAARIEANRRRITNVGTFRAYVTRYLRNHPHVHQEMMILVRQLNPTANGLPIEIYCFTNNTQWVFYEGVQSDIFDHLLAILPEFGLRVFQSPSGHDFHSMLAASSAKTVVP